MSKPPKPTPPSATPPPEETSELKSDGEASGKLKNGWTIDHSLLATIALSIISLCALIVSIYQTRVLSQQQEVMAEQQRIMTESAKAQLWPSVGLGRNRSFDSEGKQLQALEFTIANSGTGPAIVEKATVQYAGEYAKSWGEFFRLTNYPDTLSTVRDDGLFFGKVFPANESSVFLGLSDNQPLMEHMSRIINNEGFTIAVCYRSVFDDYWLREHKFGRDSFSRLTPVDSCVIVDSLAFRN